MKNLLVQNVLLMCSTLLFFLRFLNKRQNVNFYCIDIHTCKNIMI
jgi:hypothetical protein